MATSFTASVLKRKLSSVGLTDYKINIMEYGKEILIDDFICYSDAINSKTA